MGRARKGIGSVASEYDGTGPAGDGTGGAVISGPSEPVGIEPDAAFGTGSPGGRDTAGTEFDATIHSGERNGDGTWAKRRGRKAGGNRGGGGNPRKKTAAADLNSAIEGLTKTLVIVHAGIAGVTKTPEFVIDDQEGRLLANAAANVLEEFDLKPDPKTQAIVGLVVAAGTVYGPRVVMLQIRRAQEKAQKAANTDGVGVAGVYHADGSPAGTTEFNVNGAGPEWPVSATAQ